MGFMVDDLIIDRSHHKVGVLGSGSPETGNAQVEVRSQGTCSRDVVEPRMGEAHAFGLFGYSHGCS